MGKRIPPKNNISLPPKPRKKPRKVRTAVPFVSANIVKKWDTPLVDNPSRWLDLDKLPQYLRHITQMPCWPEVEPRMFDGEPIPSLAQYIHDVRGEATGISRHNLESYLWELRKAAPVCERFGQQVPGYRERMAKRYGGRLFELDTLCEALGQHVDRVNKLMSRERMTDDYNPNIRQELDLLAKLLNGAFQLKTELGLVGQTEHEVTGQSIEIVNKVRAELGDKGVETLMNPTSVGRVLAAYKLARQAAGLEGLDLATDYKYADVDGGRMINVTPLKKEECSVSE